MGEPPSAEALFSVPGLDCPDELHLIARGLANLPGVVDLIPDYVERRLRIRYDGSAVDPGRLSERLATIGFPGVLVTKSLPVVEAPALRPQAWVLTGGLLLAAAGLVYGLGSTGLGPPALSHVGRSLAVAAALLAGVPVLRAAWRAVRLRAIDMNVLMSIAAAGGLAAGEVFEVATALFLFGVSLWLESYSMGRARRAVRSLAQLAPPSAHRLRRAGELPIQGAQAVDVPAEDLAVGDLILIRPGERVPCDGRIAAGNSALDQAALTGESVPSEKGPGDRVLSGALNGAGALEVVVEQTAEHSTLAQMARLVAQAQSTRSPTERFVDRFARYYTPAVIALAALLAFVPLAAGKLGASWAQEVPAASWIHRALVLLVIACPCALVISTPLTIVSGLYRAARRGILVKGGEALEGAGRVTAIAFDKTGTLTSGRFAVVAIAAAPGTSDDELLARAAALETQSEHPLARAIVAAANERGLPLPAVREFRALPGLGAEGILDGELHFVASVRLARERGLATDGAAGPLGATGVWVARGRQLLGVLWLRDELRGDAADAVAELRALGIDPIALVTGDGADAARAAAEPLGITSVHAGLLPAEKVQAIESLIRSGPGRPHVVAMVGDGVNDAPVLASAAVGIAFGASASDLALETASAVVLAPKLTRIPELIALGRRCRRILWQNIALALAIKGAILAAAALGHGTLWLAVAADVGASLLVIANGMRLLGGDREPH